jgi:hypothetical protein
MKKKVTGLFIFAVITAILTGCEEGTVMYEGKDQPVSTVEEIIADKLEVDNPELDLEVSITEESDD